MDTVLISSFLFTFVCSSLSAIEAAQVFQSRRSELQGIASKIGELEGEADEHK